MRVLVGDQGLWWRASSFKGMENIYSVISDSAVFFNQPLAEPNYSLVLPAAFTLAHLALAAAAILARPAALMPDFFLTTGLIAGLLTFAQRAFCAAAILARAAALSFRLFFETGAATEAVDAEPRMEASFFSQALILSLMAAARFSCAEVRDNRSLMVDPL